MIFPNVVFVGNAIKSSFQYKVPIDDENTLHLTWYFYRGAPGHDMPLTGDGPYYRVPLITPTVVPSMTSSTTRTSSRGPPKAPSPTAPWSGSVSPTRASSCTESSCATR
jgi:hypothetical protein